MQANGFNPEVIKIYEKDGSKLSFLRNEFPDCHIVQTIGSAITDTDIIILAIRPQELEALETEIRGYSLTDEQAVISIVTAKTLEKLAQVMASSSIIRCSTNILLESGSGSSFWMTGSNIPDNLLGACRKIIASWGYNREVKSEKEINTAITDSGCMPGIISYLFDGLIKSMVARGRNEKEATELVLSIAQYTAKRERENNLKPSEVVAEVKTPGGITASACEIFDSVGLMEIIHEALLAADKRVEELI
jgi:pyrroline-5-carboxylate reductase